MFAEVKDSLPVSGDGYDGEIIRHIKAAVLDLTSSTEIRLDGVVDITREQQEIENPDYDPNDPNNTEPETIMAWVIEDNSTIEDELAITAISVWCNMRIGNPPNYRELREAYDSLKGQMRLSRRYGGGCRCDS